MPFTLEEITYGDTNYIQKLEAWRNALIDNIAELNSFLGISQGAGVSPALLEIFDRPGVIGEGSYKVPIGGLSGPAYNLTIPAGAAIDAALTFYRKTTSTVISMAGRSTGTYYLNLTGTGYPEVATSASSATFRQFEWDSAQHAVTSQSLYGTMAVLFDGSDYAACLVSLVRSKTFLMLSTRLEEIEALIGAGVQEPASANSVAIDWSEGGVARVLLNRATTTFAFSGAYDGQKCILEITQDGGGGRAVAFGAEVVGGADFTLPIPISSAGDKTDEIGFIYHATSGKYRYVSLARGY